MDYQYNDDQNEHPEEYGNVPEKVDLTKVACHFCRVFHVGSQRTVPHNCPCHDGRLTYSLPEVKISPVGIDPALFKIRPYCQYIMSQMFFNPSWISVPQYSGFSYAALLSLS